MTIDPLQLLLAAGAAPATGYPPSSRYHATPVVHDANGVAYLARRLVPAPERFAQTGEVLVEHGDRADLLSAAHLGDPELYWRLCDANRVLDPSELEDVGRRVRIPLPEGIVGVPDA